MNAHVFAKMPKSYFLRNPAPKSKKIVATFPIRKKCYIVRYERHIDDDYPILHNFVFSDSQKAEEFFVRARAQKKLSYAIKRVEGMTFCDDDEGTEKALEKVKRLDESF